MQRARPRVQQTAAENEPFLWDLALPGYGRRVPRRPRNEEKDMRLSVTSSVVLAGLVAGLASLTAAAAAAATTGNPFGPGTAGSTGTRHRRVLGHRRQPARTSGRGAARNCRHRWRSIRAQPDAGTAGSAGGTTGAAGDGTAGRPARRARPARRRRGAARATRHGRRGGGRPRRHHEGRQDGRLRHRPRHHAQQDDHVHDRDDGHEARQVRHGGRRPEQLLRGQQLRAVDVQPPVLRHAPGGLRQHQGLPARPRGPRLRQRRSGRLPAQRHAARTTSTTR